LNCHALGSASGSVPIPPAKKDSDTCVPLSIEIKLVLGRP